MELLIARNPDPDSSLPFLIRLPVIDEEELRGMLEDAWWEAATPAIRRRNPAMWRSGGDG